MSSETPMATRFDQLVNQIRWVTRISVALSTAVNIDDVYSVLISGFISPMGLGYSRATVIDTDVATRQIRIRYVVGYENREERDETLAELENEVEFLDRRLKELRVRAAKDGSAAEELRTLELGSQWVTLFQRLGVDNDVNERLRRMTFDMPDPSDTGGPDNSLFARIQSSQRPRRFHLRENGIKVPDELRGLIAQEFAVVPLRTGKGLRGLILLDRHLTGEPIDADALESLDWFGTQGALALQNAELIADLEKAYEELKAVDQLKSNFLSIISHELRTPLTAISGFVELILNGKAGEVSDRQRSLLDRVSKNTGHLSNMVNDIIEIAEIKAEGMSSVNLRSVDPLETLFATLPKLEYRRRDSHVDIDPVVHGTVPNIVCDEQALERIYFHLIDNAVKFSPPNQTVGVEFDRVGDTALSITIRDRGQGIPPDKLQLIFDEFYQVDNSLTRSHEGLGLGLAVTRILVQATRGEITVNSTPGEGSSFTLIYPVA